MNRVILTPAPGSTLPPSSALAELKQWLGITVSADDAPLNALLAAAMDACEAFTGTMPLEASCEEVLPPASCWRRLATRPVQAICAVDAIAPDGSRTSLAPGSWDMELDADGGGHVRAHRTGSGTRIAVRFTAGLAADWDALPPSLRHGIVRLAAHQHRQRDSDGAAPLPPASIAALWRPWRRMRLA